LLRDSCNGELLRDSCNCCFATPAMVSCSATPAIVASRLLHCSPISRFAKYGVVLYHGSPNTV